MKRFKTRGGGRNLSSNKGFTLAEVLVTLGVIGVVSAMTVPTLMQNYQRKSYVTQLHKFYNELSQALLQYQTDRNAVSLVEAGLNSNDAIYNFFNTYFKIVNKCENSTPCMASEYKSMSGKTIGSKLSGFLVLASGTSLTYAYDAGSKRVMGLYVDVNGPKGPNIAGRDMFAIYVYKNGLIDDISIDDGNAPLTTEQREAAFAKCDDVSGKNWYGCFGKILNDNWEMTY